MRIARNETEVPVHKPPHRLVTLLWSAILTGHATVAVAWWWLMPGGFPVSSPRFWINRIAPVFILILSLAARYFWGKQRPGLLAMLLFLSTMWIGLAMGLRTFFPITFAWFWIGPLVVGIGLTILARTTIDQPLNQLVRLATALGITFGAWTATTQKAMPPCTRPLNAAMTIPSDLPQTGGSIPLSKSVRVDAGQGTVQILSIESQLFIEPLLTFDSRSPDRCWTLFARRKDRVGPRRTLLGAEAAADGKSVRSYYESDFLQSLRVEVSDSTSLQIESFAELKQEIDSHLNTFTELMLTSVRSPRVSFSPCPNVKIDITYAQYPFGKPHRFAYLADDGIFRVVEASSAEKGPFRTLASGKLSRGETLGMTLYDGDSPRYTVELSDWTSQLSTQLSPTAGWGVAENSIEFSRASESPRSAVSIFITLANTSVGRGFDSVGHAPGIYRNRLRVTDHQH